MQADAETAGELRGSLILSLSGPTHETNLYRGYIGVILGLYWGSIGVI